MDLKNLLLSIFAILWTIGVIAQQIYWIQTEGYSAIAFLWAIIELCIPYLIFKAMEN